MKLHKHLFEVSLIFIVLHKIRNNLDMFDILKIMHEEYSSLYITIIIDIIYSTVKLLLHLITLKLKEFCSIYSMYFSLKNKFQFC